MKRDIVEVMLRWKDSQSRKPLIVRGARQVGKTYSVKLFGAEHFKDCVVFDFERDRSLQAIFSGDLSPSKIVRELEIYAGKRIVPGETVVFFDEIQACERALMSLRYFYEEMPELHILAAGSLLEFAMSSISFPVGRVTFEWMRPMTFKEFLVASGKEILAENIPDRINISTVSENLHHSLVEQLRLYFLVGGMPEAVKRFVETGSLTEAQKVHEDIIQSYLQSLLSYETRTDSGSLDHLMRSIPSHVGAQIKYTHLDPERRIEKTKKSLAVLEKALLVHLIQATDVSGLPLGAGTSAKIMKPLFVDIGLMQTICGIDVKEILHAKDINHVYRGALAEQFVGQELLAAGGSENGKLYYWSRRKKSSSAEVDFVIARNGCIYPIEVKSGAAGRMKSMHIFLAEHPFVEKGFVLSPVKHEKQEVDRIEFLPLYVTL